MCSNVNVKFEAMERDIRDILTGFEHGMLNKAEATEQLLNLHFVSFRFIEGDNVIINEKINTEIELIRNDGSIWYYDDVCVLTELKKEDSIKLYES